MFDIISYLILAGVGTCVALLVIGHYLNKRSWIVIFKTLASLGLLAYWFSLAPATTSHYGGLIGLALLFGVIGDVLLLGRKTLLFALGMAAFALGHIIYMIAFSGFDSSTGSFFAGLLVMWICGSRVYVWLKPGIAQQLRLPVLLYGGLLTAMTALALSLRIDQHFTLMGLGALLFMLSDFFVATHRFKTPKLIDKAVGLPLYYAGQLILATSIVIQYTQNPWLPV
ncbi:MAG: lysoplasmalogenase [Gammaproteobacteria bacterium]|nr:lysoplasmalogenase [Gammaproteobacteria bacterium]